MAWQGGERDPSERGERHRRVWASEAVGAAAGRRRARGETVREAGAKQSERDGVSGLCSHCPARARTYARTHAHTHTHLLGLASVEQQQQRHQADEHLVLGNLGHGLLLGGLLAVLLGRGGGGGGSDVSRRRGQPGEQLC